MEQLDDQQIVDKLGNGDESLFRQLYSQYKDDFQEWARNNFSLDVEDALDIFQDALIALYDNAVKGKLTNLTVKLKTYLYAIAKHLIYRRYRQTKNIIYTDNPGNSMNDVPFEELAIEDEGLTERQLEVVRALDTMREPCQSILKLFYYRSYSMEEMAERFGYKNTTTMKMTKMRCMNELRQKVL